MAKRVIEQLVSDLSGKDIKDGEGETVKFSIGSTSYEMDLTEAEAGRRRHEVHRRCDQDRRSRCALWWWLQEQVRPQPDSGDPYLGT